MNGTLKLALFAVIALTAFGLLTSPAAAEDNVCMGQQFEFCADSMDDQLLDDDENICMGGQFSFCNEAITPRPLDDDNVCMGGQFRFCA